MTARNPDPKFARLDSPNEVEYVVRLLRASFPGADWRDDATVLEAQRRIRLERTMKNLPATTVTVRAARFRGDFLYGIDYDGLPPREKQVLQQRVGDELYRLLKLKLWDIAGASWRERRDKWPATMELTTDGDVVAFAQSLLRLDNVSRSTIPDDAGLNQRRFSATIAAVCALKEASARLNVDAHVRVTGRRV